MSLPGNVTELLTALSAVMSATKVRWYLFGAQAVLIWFRGILRHRAGTLDVERIRSLLHLIEQALDRSDLASVFEKQWREVTDSSEETPFPKG